MKNRKDGAKAEKQGAQQRGAPKHGKVDESTRSKRKLTDLARDDFRIASEQQTDSSLAVARTTADAAAVVSREQADAARILGVETPEESIRFERQRADEVIAQERSRADVAFSIERGERRKVEEDLLRNERTTIDQGIALERRQSDQDLATSAGVLRGERTAHLATKAALTTREELMAIVSHDLRNPIGAISMCSQMLLDASSNQRLDDETRTWITFIKRNADGALRLVGDLLDMERISNGKIELRRSQCDLSEIVAEAVQSLSAVAAAKSILLRAFPIKASAKISCDRDRILQVIANLVGNAVKFTQDGGQVEVRVQSGEAGEAQVSVSDNGPGIPADRIDRIFERFLQLGMKDRHGLGLGLYISKMITEAHHGSLRVESVVGRGSTFTLSLPLSPDH